MMITGSAAGVRFVAAEPSADGRRLVAAWHLLGEPGTPEDMAATLPMTGVDAWRVYLPLPEIAVGADMLVDGYAPMVESAVAVLPQVIAELRRELGCDDGPVDLVGGSAGGHIALVAAARNAVPVRRVAVVNPAITARAVVEATTALSGEVYHWTDDSENAAEPLDVLARADRLHDVNLLVVRGSEEYPAFTPAQDALCAAVPGARLVEVPGLPHMLVSHTDRVDAEVTRWLA